VRMRLGLSGEDEKVGGDLALFHDPSVGGLTVIAPSGPIPWPGGLRWTILFVSISAE